MTDRIPEYGIKLIEERFTDCDERADALRRYSEHEPLAYILGEWGFYDQMYHITPDCLVPRPDTEHVVDKLIELLPRGGRFLDLCTGSGCIAVSALVHRPDCTAAALDISAGAVGIAKKNAEKYGVSERMEFICADLAEPESVGGQFDIIVSNPPYIRSGIIDSLQKELSYEPREALDGGEDGLRFYRIIVDRYRAKLKAGGKMIFEIGYDQADALRALGAREIFRDYGGNDRVAVLYF